MGLEEEVLAYYKASFKRSMERLRSAVPEKEEQLKDEENQVAKETNVREEAEKAGKKVNSPMHALSIVRSNTREIELPKDLTYGDAIKALEMKAKAEEEETQVIEMIDAFPFDGALAFGKAMQRVYGWTTPVPTPSFFGPCPPKTIEVKVGYKETVKVLWGRFEIPGMSGWMETGADWSAEPPKFVISAIVRKKHEDKVRELAALTRKIVAEESIYKSKGLVLTTNDEGNVKFQDGPGFLDLENVNSAELVLPKAVGDIVRAALFVPIEQTDACRESRIPLKRGVLLAGPYGTGKTLTAFVTAKKCVENNWTFIYLDRVSGLNQALQFAKRYQPCVIFAEDIDRSVTGERSVEMDDILNTIDGIEAKSSEIITILTTNHVEDINRAMLRPGRLDAVVTFQAPDAEAVERLVRQYGRGLVPSAEDLSEVGVALAGNIPAVIREVMERAKLFALSLNPGQTIRLTSEALLGSTESMRSHLDLMAEKPKVELDPDDAALGALMKLSVVRGLNGTKEAVIQTAELVKELHDKIIN